MAHEDKIDLAVFEQSKKVRHELSDMSLSGATKWTIYFTAFFSICIVVAFFVYIYMFKNNVGYRAPKTPSVIPPAPYPMLQDDRSNSGDIQALREKEDRLTSGYGWTSKAKGTVHVPISKAIDEVAQSGVPSWPDSYQPKPPASTPTGPVRREEVAPGVFRVPIDPNTPTVALP
jgi:hypothetical protein